MSETALVKKEETKVSPLKPKLKEITLTTKERSSILQLNGSMPVKKGDDAARALRIARFLGSDDWEDWQEWQIKNDMPDEFADKDYIFEARKKDLKAIAGLIKGAVAEGVLHGNGVLTLNPIYIQVAGESLDPDDDE